MDERENRIPPPPPHTNIKFVDVIKDKKLTKKSSNWIFAINLPFSNMGRDRTYGE